MVYLNFLFSLVLTSIFPLKALVLQMLLLMTPLAVVATYLIDHLRSENEEHWLSQLQM